ncbi:LysR family transcriptional regulator [Stappia stellulata]|uniref:LysR family transcriptional regulator n=1 Tax=Stappia stellulata TaxID=71235 RepID=UPI000A0334BF|nr:LysR family transcriptional regulator [Stappia stellulata]
MAGQLLPTEKMFRVFEACASNGTFTAAGGAMGISQSAVSQQIRQLEHRLGLELFQKNGRSIVLTPAGRSILKAQRDAFSSLRRAIENTQKQKDSLRTIVQVLPGFCARWLLPRLSSFNCLRPDVEVVIVSDHDQGFLNPTADVTISYEMVQETTSLAQEDLFPVASRAFVSKHSLAELSPKTLLSKLAELPLLGDTSISGYDTWDRWASEIGIDLPRQHRQVFPQSNMSLLLAEHGQGIAMGRSFLVLDALAAGTLVELSGLRVPASVRYVLRYNPDRIMNAGSRAFEEWIVRKAEEELG